MGSVVDLDDPSTWPEQFHELATSAADTYSGASHWEYDDEAAKAALKGFRVRAYHCTRLTPREVDDIKCSGLKPLSANFTLERLANAVDDGHLTEEDAEFYGQTGEPQERGRAGRVHLFTGQASLMSPGDIGWLVEFWGGEGITMALSSHSPEMERLKHVGTPSVVIMAVDLDLHCTAAHPGILFSAANRLRSEDAGTTIVSHAAIGPDYIEAIEQPTGDFWRRYVWGPEGLRAGHLNGCRHPCYAHDHL